MDIVTRRLRLDALRSEDVTALFAYRSDPATSRWQGWTPASPADAARFIESHHDTQPGTTGRWWQRAIRLRVTGELIGDAGLHFLDDATVELGITMTPAYQRRGYAHEACSVMLDFAFGGLQMQRAIARVLSGNFRSMRLLEGLGMRRMDARADEVLFILKRAAWLAPPAHWADRG